MLNKEHSPRSNIVILTVIAIACSTYFLFLMLLRFIVLDYCCQHQKDVAIEKDLV